MTWFACGGGTSAASFSTISAGESWSAVVPSDHARFMPTATVPSSRRSSRPFASGGRRMYRHSRSSPTRSEARTDTPALRL